MKLIVTFFLGSLLSAQIIGTLADLEVPVDFCLDRNPGWYNHPDDCNGFIYCFDGEGFAGRCQDNLHFRPGDVDGEGVCTYPEVAECDPDAGGGGGERECLPGVIWEERVSETCNQYVRCIDGQTETRTCTDDLHWHSEVGQCMSPNLANCPYPICSANPPEDRLEFLPHPTDCTLFYICVNQVPMQHECGPGQHFDRVTRMCLAIADAQC